MYNVCMVTCLKRECKTYGSDKNICVKCMSLTVIKLVHNTTLGNMLV